MLGGRHDLPAQRRPQAMNHPPSAPGGAHDPSLDQPELAVTGQGVGHARPAGDDVLDGHPLAAVGVEHLSVADDALGETVQRERRDGVHDLVGRAALDSLPGHPRAQLGLDVDHATLAALEAERAAELLGLAAAEAGGHHRHA